MHSFVNEHSVLLSLGDDSNLPRANLADKRSFIPTPVDIECPYRHHLFLNMLGFKLASLDVVLDECKLPFCFVVHMEYQLLVAIKPVSSQ